MYIQRFLIVIFSVFCSGPPPPAQECVTLQPSMLDFMQRRGRVLKKMGALTMAAGAVDSARELDKADRYMNSKVPVRSYYPLVPFRSKPFVLFRVTWTARCRFAPAHFVPFRVT